MAANWIFNQPVVTGLFLEIKLSYNYMGIKIHRWSGFESIDNNYHRLSDVHFEFQLNKNNHALRKWIQSVKEFTEGDEPAEVYLAQYTPNGVLTSKWKFENAVVKNYSEETITNKTNLMKYMVTLTCTGIHPDQ
jgi:hypothetical protein